MAIQIKRTTEDIRKESDVILASGQPLYDVDTKQLYVGDGESVVSEMNPVGAANLQASGENSIQSINTTIKKNQPDTITDYDPLDPVYDPSSETFDISWVTKGRLNPSAGATGTESIAIGKGLEASGHRSTVFGARNFAGGWGDFAAGQGNYIKASEGAVFGACNLVDGSSYSFISGYGNSIQDAEDVADKTNSTTILGMSNKIKNSQRSFIAGQSNEIDRAQRNIVLGKSNKLTGTKMNNDNIMIGESNTITDVNSVIVLGRHNSVTKAGATLIGTGLLPSAAAANPVVIGAYNAQDDNYPFIIGVGNSSTRYSAIMIPSGSDLSSKVRRILLNGNTQISGDLMVNTFSVNSNKLRIKDSKIESELPMDLAAKFTLTGAMTSTRDVLFYKNHGTWSNKINFNDGTLKVFADAAVGDSDATTITRKQITTPLVVGNLTGLASKATADKNGNDIVATYGTKIEVAEAITDAVSQANTYTDNNISALRTSVNQKANKATTLSGYGITNAYTIGQTDGLIEELDDDLRTLINAKLDKSIFGANVSDDNVYYDDRRQQYYVALNCTGDSSYDIGTATNLMSYIVKSILSPDGKAISISGLTGSSITSCTVKNSANVSFNNKVSAGGPGVWSVKIYVGCQF